MNHKTCTLKRVSCHLNATQKVQVSKLIKPETMNVFDTVQQWHCMLIPHNVTIIQFVADFTKISFLEYNGAV